MAINNSRLFGFPDTFPESLVSGKKNQTKTKQNKKQQTNKKVISDLSITLQFTCHNLYPIWTSTLADLPPGV